MTEETVTQIFPDGHRRPIGTKWPLTAKEDPLNLGTIEPQETAEADAPPADDASDGDEDGPEIAALEPMLGSEIPTGTEQASTHPEPQPEPLLGSDTSFDPADHTSAEVQAYVEAWPEDRDAVLSAERAGKNRSTLVKHLEG